MVWVAVTGPTTSWSTPASQSTTHYSIGGEFLVTSTPEYLVTSAGLFLVTHSPSGTYTDVADASSSWGAVIPSSTVWSSI